MGSAGSALMGSSSPGNGQAPYLTNPNAGQTYYSEALDPMANSPFTAKDTKNPNAAAKYAQAARLKPTNIGMTTPNLFKPYEQYMPDEYNQAAPIYDSSNILNAYTQHMPDFMAGSKSMYQYKTPEQINNPSYVAPSSSSGFMGSPFSYAIPGLNAVKIGKKLSGK
jgi:hypothetical protein